MKTRLLKISTTVIIALAMLLSISCSQPKVFRVGIVNINTGLISVIEGFKSDLAKAGYHEGKNITFIQRGTLNLKEVDAELERLKKENIDLILTLTGPVTHKAKKAVDGTKIPVVFAPVLFPLKGGLIESLPRPGGNLTGVQVGGSTEKALEWHKRAFPQSKHILAPFRIDENSSTQALVELQAAGEKLEVKITPVGINNLAELKTALKNIPEGVDAIWLLNSSLLVPNIDVFVDSAIEHKLPLSSGTSQYNRGVMLSYAQDLTRTGEQAGRIARKILEGELPANIPVETCEFFLGLNAKTAQAIGVTFPDSVLQQANDIIR